MRISLPIVSLLLVAAAEGRSAELSAQSLRTDGLNFGDDIARLYVGDFARVGFARDSTELALLLGSYMTAFSRQCAAELPTNKVEIMAQECERESWTVNGFGAERPGSRHCVSYRSVGTGRYADPEVYALQRRLDAAMAGTMTQDMLTGMLRKGGDAAGGMRRMTDLALYARNDMPQLLQANGCAHPAVQRLQANLLRFGNGAAPIVLPGGAAALAQAAPADGPARGQDHKRLLEDLIAEQSQAWMMNRFLPGSVRPGTVLRDAQGQATEVLAGYGYTAMGKTYPGKVRLTFRDGVPQCLYYADIPDTCRVPSPKILSAYRKNHYAAEIAAAPPPPNQAASPAPAAAPMATVTPTPVALAPNPAPADPAPSVPGRDAAATLAPADLQERQAALRERRCATLRLQVERLRESLATTPPQRVQQLELHVARLEAAQAQHCGR
ncbi:hypothetical protein AACH10_12645 [Ideonella sp. DXS22W]|uniref:Uncharacterized protein n=1 Tax=Pseudaquabacterium inlustre TaxID=2984192 RepID=A0ABU9CJL9_9BURK